MPNSITISQRIRVNRAHLRRFVLAYQHLLPPRKLRGKSGVLAFIRKVNCAQYDPINVVGQNPHLVLQSRVRHYRPVMLDGLLYSEHKLVDGFDKQMSIYPVEDWPSFSFYREQHAKLYAESESAAEAIPLMDPVLAEIRERGPLSSLEIEGDKRMDWWLTGSVRAVRIALDMLLYSGKIIVSHRVGTRRYFDLAERILPAELLGGICPHATRDEYLDWHVYRRVGGIGIIDHRTGAHFGGTIGWRGGKVRESLKRLVEARKLVGVEAEDLPRQRFFIRSDDLPALEAASMASTAHPQAALIAPLDNLMWDLPLIEALFGFRYRWEVYKPAAKRDYGYYVLPVLYGDRFIARMHPAFDRFGRTVTIKNWWWEEGVQTDDPEMLSALRSCLVDFAAYLGAERLKSETVFPSHQHLVGSLQE